nr:exocyst complex component EXO70B1-like [Coffea arabica]
MNLTKDLFSLYSESKVIFDGQASQIPSSQLKLQFQDILFNPKYPIGADQFLKSSNNSVSPSASITDSSCMTLHYEDYKGHHKVFSEEDIKTLRRISEILTSRNELAIVFRCMSSVERTRSTRKSLIDLVARPQSSNDRDPPEVVGSHEMDERPISIESHLTRVIEFLLYNLKFKSNFYGQESLGFLFMMNNVNSVSEMIKSSEELGELIGTRLRMKLSEKVELARADYLHTSWGEVCDFLKGKGLKSDLNFDFFPGRSTRAVKKKFRTFNRMFEDILQTQEGWMVPDQQLRMKLLECIMVKLIPAYNQFLEQLSRVHKVKNLNGYITYSVKDLETKVLTMFQSEY